MNKEKPLKEIEEILEPYGEIKEPIIVKRKNKKDVVIISFEEYKKKILETDIIEKLKQSEEDIENGRIVDAKLVLQELSEKYEK